MPTTYNGIGTHYYGKKNLQKRTAACHSCGRTVELTSYDTRLWFVIVFIPIIPLGRKRIIDYCPSCTRHYLVEADKWETAKQLEVSGAQEKFRTEPTAENAIAVHQQLLHFHQLDQAAGFQSTMAEKFLDNAKVQAYLGAALTHLGKLKEAAPFYARALELRPDLPEARSGVALGYVRDGKLDEARALLDFLEKPGASKLYDLEPLNVLAQAYQKANRHNAALEVFASLLKELPKLGEEAWFRKLVAKSEVSPGGKDSLLPKQKFSWKRFLSLQRSARPATTGPQVTWRGLAIVGILLGVIALSFVISNEYIRRHRKLFIVSGFKEPALVEVRGVGTVRTSRDAVELPLKEGRYHAVINGPVRQEVDFEIKAGYWSRWLDDPAWVLNVGGSALLQLEQAVYARNAPPVQYSFHFGKPFHYFDRVTHPFRELPSTVQMKSGETRTLISLDLVRREPGYAFLYFEQQRNLPEAMRLAEWRLRVQPDDEMMLGLYFNAAMESRQTERAEKFLHAGLTNRPVLIQWHRLYEGLRRDATRATALATEYDSALAADPTNSALLYLRGRVAQEREESRTWFQRACDADPNNAFPFFALGFDRMSVGDWTGARKLFARACALRPKQPEFMESFMEVRTALGEFADVEKELRQQLAGEPLSYLAIRRLCDVLLAAGRQADAEQAVRQFESSAMSRARENAREPNADLHRHLLYATGNFAALEKQTATERSPAAAYARYTALIELGRLDEATKLFPLQSEAVNNPFHFLNAAIAWRLAGNMTEAARWQERTVALLAQGDADMARAAVLFQKSTPPTQVELDAVAIPVEAKASILAALAQIHPARRVEFAAQARRLNVVWSFPHHLLARAAAETP
jgi:tetratricopeptide (TPR) repeat protein